MYSVSFRMVIKVKNSLSDFETIFMQYDATLPFIPSKEIEIFGIPGFSPYATIEYTSYNLRNGIFHSIITPIEGRKETLKSQVAAYEKLGWKLIDDEEKILNEITKFEA